MIDRNQSIEDQARQAHALRNQFRTNARDLMLNQDERKWLDKSHPNLTFEEQVDKKMSDKGMTRDEAIQDILKTASKSNKKVIEKFKL